MGCLTVFLSIVFSKFNFVIRLSLNNITLIVFEVTLLSSPYMTLFQSMSCPYHILIIKQQKSNFSLRLISHQNKKRRKCIVTATVEYSRMNCSHQFENGGGDINVAIRGTLVDFVKIRISKIPI